MSEDEMQALLRGAQYREREALAEAAMLRARLDDARAESAVRLAGARAQTAIALFALGRWRAVNEENAALRARAQADAGDLAGLARRGGA